jgi:hypothetical protein
VIGKAANRRQKAEKQTVDDEGIKITNAHEKSPGNKFLRL